MDQNTNNIPVQEGSKGMAITALVLGIISITIGCCTYFIGVPTSIAATILGGIAISKKKPGKGMAVAGLVMGIIGIVIIIISIIMIVALGSSMVSLDSILNSMN